MAAEKGDDLYVSSLNEDGLIRARQELNERNDQNRKEAVQHFRQWVLQQNWLKTPTDFEFLLRFLRVRKFSQLCARETFENYWMNKFNRPSWHLDIDPADPSLQEILRAKVYYSPMVYDKDGFRWIFTPYGVQSVENMKKWGLDNMYRALILFLEWITFDENTQVNGLKWFVDFSDLSMQAVLMKYSNNDDKRSVSQLLQKSTPLRMKGFYLYNEPKFFDVILKMIAPFARQKFMERIHMLGQNLIDIDKKMDTAVLPDEYLPDDFDGPSAGPESQIVEDMLEDMMSPKFRTYIRDVTSSKYGVDLDRKPKDNDVPSETFRTLTVD